MHVELLATGAARGRLRRPVSEMNVYTTAGDVFTQLGSTVAVAMGSTDSTSVVNFGNQEGGTSRGRFISRTGWWITRIIHSRIAALRGESVGAEPVDGAAERAVGAPAFAARFLAYVLPASSIFGAETPGHGSRSAGRVSPATS